MAEALGVVTGILGLLPLCRSGFIMVKEITEARGTMKDLLARIETHHGHFLSWLEIWGDETSREANLREYEEGHPISAREILRQLGLFSRLFFDFKGLQKYGFSIEGAQYQGVDDFHFESDTDLAPERIEGFRLSCNANFSLTQRFKFVLTGRDKKLEEFISRLREYNEVLWRYGPRVEVARLNKGVYDKIGNVVADQLQRLFTVYTDEANSTTNRITAQRYHALARMANFRSQVQLQASTDVKPVVFRIGDFHFTENYVLGLQGQSTLALLPNYPWPGQSRVALIEWIQNTHLPGRKRDAEKLALLLSTPKPNEMRVPDCYGIVDSMDVDDIRLGLVMKPPSHIRTNLPQQLQPGAISERRMPVNLRELITETGSYCRGVSLGTRFTIAKQLVDTIHMIHATEWVHKNIRSESVLFFPVGELDVECTKKFDFDNLLLAGLNNARAQYQPQGTNYAYGGGTIAQLAARNMTFDYYQHPAKVSNPNLTYRRLYDLYSLGCVLLELGLWRTLDQRIPSGIAGAYETMRAIRALADGPDLDRLMGSIYGDIVRECLYLGERTELSDPTRFGTDIASRLAQCYA